MKTDIYCRVLFIHHVAFISYLTTTIFFISTFILCNMSPPSLVPVVFGMTLTCSRVRRWVHLLASPSLSSPLMASFSAGFVQPSSPSVPLLNRSREKRSVIKTLNSDRVSVIGFRDPTWQLVTGHIVYMCSYRWSSNFDAMELLLTKRHWNATVYNLDLFFKHW